ncbi:hypothetical protein BGZ72_009112 [Mortierella alpina]|nr:hypothetical protein BGZ72_009112 [Mortierella alpina]
MNDTATESSTVTPPKLETAADVVAARLAGNSNAPPTSQSSANGEFQEYRRERWYHDRLAGQKDRPKNQPRYLLDKEEIMDEKQELQPLLKNGPGVPGRLRKRDTMIPRGSGSSSDDYIASHKLWAYNQEGEMPTLKRRHELKEVETSE